MMSKEDGTLCNSIHPTSNSEVSFVDLCLPRDTADGEHYFSLCVVSQIALRSNEI
jgi:hypothetical protein